MFSFRSALCSRTRKHVVCILARLQTLHVILHCGGMVPQYTDRLSQMAALLAAIMHDYEHMGLTNDYLVNSSSVLAIRYNDRAPLVRGRGWCRPCLGGDACFLSAHCLSLGCGMLFAKL